MEALLGASGESSGLPSCSGSTMLASRLDDLVFEATRPIEGCVHEPPERTLPLGEMTKPPCAHRPPLAMLLLLLVTSLRPPLTACRLKADELARRRP